MGKTVLGKTVLGKTISHEMAWRAAGLLLLATTASGASAQDKASGRVVLAPHRAIYDLVLDDGKQAKSIEAARGRIAFDFTGDACEGYALSFRQVTQLTTGEGGPRTIDARTTSFETGDGQSYRFKTESKGTDSPSEVVNGIAQKSAAPGYEVKLTEPKPETVKEDTDALFPNGQMKAIIQAAREGKNTLTVRLYDGANTGKDVYETLAVIGKRVTTPAKEAPLQRPEFEALARWPVTISYFKVGSGETTPSYSIAFELYENGITGMVKMDYGSFGLVGRLTRLDLLPQPDCAK